MGSLNVQMDERTLRAVELAKAIARHEGSGSLDTVHVLRGAMLAYPDDVTHSFREELGSATQAVRGSPIPYGSSGKESGKMPLTEELTGILRRLSRNGEIVTLDRLLMAILRNPSYRVRSFLCCAQGNATLRTRALRPHETTVGYSSKRDWLMDLHLEWKLRMKCAQACGISIGYSRDDLKAPYQDQGVLDTLARVSNANRRKAQASPSGHDPLGCLNIEVDTTQRSILQGFLIDQVYGLDIHVFGGLTVRDLAQMLSPAIYPGNCHKVLSATKDLESSGLIKRCDGDEHAEMNVRLHLTDSLIGQLLAGFEGDAMSEGEVSEMKRRLRHAVDWCDD